VKEKELMQKFFIASKDTAAAKPQVAKMCSLHIVHVFVCMTLSKVLVKDVLLLTITCIRVLAACFCFEYWV